MLDFTRGLSASETHRHLKSADQAMEEAKQNALLWFGEIVTRKLFQDLGYGTVLAVMQSSVDGNSNQLEKSAAAPPVQIHVHQCPDCHKAAVQTSRGELPLSSAETERIQCDAQVSHPHQRNSTTIPPKIRRYVLARERHRCQGKGCENTHYLEVHHIVPRARGGTHDPENLTTLCSACHALVHRQGVIAGSIAGERPTLYSPRGTSPLRNCIDEMGRSDPVPRHS